ncbi:IS5 family transposase [Mesorhizobium sp. M1428]|uniref:IS5 family transposase n=1 Tax=unclassified Mesorhizobium TaxID=325217 RepID=UPI00333903E0
MTKPSPLPLTRCASYEGDRDYCLGRSRCGLTTKIHALVDAEGRPIKLTLTAGQMSDIGYAADLIKDLPEGAMLLADKGYDANALRNAVTERMGQHPAQGQPQGPNVLQPLSLQGPQPRRTFFNKAKQFRRIATRYDKLAENYLAALKLVSTRIWLRGDESTS